MIGKSSALVNKKRYDEAIVYTNIALEKNTSNGQAWILRGDVLRYAFEHEDAVLAYQRSIDIDPALGRSYYGIGLCFYQLKRYKLAYKALKVAVTLDAENFVDAYFHLGLVSYKLRYWEKADNAFSRLCELSSNDVRGFLHRGHLHRKRGDYSKALFDYQEVLNRESENLQALTCLANIYFDLDNEVNAYTAYSKVVDLNPNDESAKLKVRELCQRWQQREIAKRLEAEREKDRQDRKRQEIEAKQKELAMKKQKDELWEGISRERSRRKKFLGLF